MSQRPIVAQVNYLNDSIYDYSIIYLNFFFCFQTPPNKTVYISQQNMKSEFQDPSN